MATSSSGELEGSSGILTSVEDSGGSESLSDGEGSGSEELVGGSELSTICQEKISVFESR